VKANFPVRLIAIAILSFLLPSCLDLEQKVTLDRDGSGELELITKTPESNRQEDNTEAKGPLGGEEAEKRAEASGVEILEQSVQTANGQVISRIRLAFDTVEELNAFMSGMDEDDQGGTFEFTLEEGDDGITFSHRIISEEQIDPKTEEESDAGGAIAEMMMANLFKDASYIIRWTLPGEVLSASEGATIEGNSVSFEIPLIALTKPSGVNVSATYENGLPAWVLPVGGGVLLLVVGIFLGRRISAR
jgi:hypothetical protein